MILLDSTALVDLLRRHPPTMERLQEWDTEGQVLATSSLNVAEVLRGEAASARRMAVARRILAGLTQLPFGPRAALRFGILMSNLDRAGTPIGAIDGMIAAVALEENATLATANLAEFERVPDLDMRHI